MSDAVVNGLAGAGGGIVAQLLTYPLQTVNTRQQTERKAKRRVGGEEVALIRGPERSHSRKFFHSEFVKTIKDEGWAGLYKGLGPSLVGTIASQGVYYYFYQIFRDEAEALSLKRKKRGSGDGTVGMLSSLLVAALAGCVNVLLTNPIWVIVTRMQTQAKAQAQALAEAKAALSSEERANVTLAQLSPPVCPHGTVATVRELYDEAGVVGFWKGVLPTLIMVSNPAIQFMLYESLIKWLTTRRPVTKTGLKHVSATEVFAAGAIAKLGATVVTYPLLVVKSRLQAKQSLGGDQGQQYRGTLDAIIKMIEHEGFLGFYKGMSTKIVQSVMAAAVLFMIKEELVRGAKGLVSKKIVAQAVL